MNNNDLLAHEHGITPSELEDIMHGPLMSDPSDRGTPEAALVDAIFAEDLDACRLLLDAEPELVNASLKQWAHLKTPHLKRDWWYRAKDKEPLCDVLPIVFACLLPWFKQPDRATRVMTESNLALIRLFIQHGAVLDQRSKWSILPDVCWNYDCPEVLEMLINLVADTRSGAPSAVDECREWSLIQLAARRGGVGTVSFLIDQGVSIEPNCIYQVGNTGRTIIYNDGGPLNAAAEEAQCEVVELLLRRGAVAHLEARDGGGMTPLEGAVPKGFRNDARNERREKVVRMLMEAGAQFLDLELVFTSRVRDWRLPCSSCSILGGLVAWGSEDIIRYVVQKGCSVHERMRFLPAAFDSLCFASDDYIESEDPISRTTGGNGVTAPHRAAQAANGPAIRALVDLHADINALDEYERTPLHWAVIVGDVNMPLNRLSPLRNVYLPTTALHELAAMMETVEQLTSRGADINIQDRFGRTALHYAAHQFFYPVIVHLVNSGVDLTLVDVDGRTVFHDLATPGDTDYEKQEKLHTEPEPELADLFAAIKGRLPSQELLNRLANGKTALHIASCSLSAPMVRLLLRLGADPNVSDASGRTALRNMLVQSPLDALRSPETYELWERRYDVVKGLLLEAGADLN